MYIIYKKKNYINHKNTISVPITIPQNTFLAAQMRSIILAGSPEFWIKSLQKRLSVSHLKKKQVKKNKISYV